jgi:glutamate decarboxylase
VVVREDFTMGRCQALLTDIQLGMKTLQEMDEKMLDKYTSYIRTNSHKSQHNHSKYKGEKHSLQGQTGKTHGVC